MAINSRGADGPVIHAADPWLPNDPEGFRRQLLGDNERMQLAKISSLARFAKGDQIYSEGQPADAAFNITNGVVATYRKFSDHRQHITAFLYPGDVFGLSEQGRYTNGSRATTAVVAYKVPIPALRRLLASNTELDVNLIIKLCEELRQSQRHAFLLAQKRAISKLAMFLDLHQHLQEVRGGPISEIYLPMDRTDIAEYLGLTLAAVSRTFRALISRNIISCPNRQHVKLLDREAFERLASARST